VPDDHSPQDTFKARADLESAWSELKQWVDLAEQWAAAKAQASAADPSTSPTVPASAPEWMSSDQLERVERWRAIFDDEIASVKQSAGSIPARSYEELQKALEAAHRLLEIPRARFP
jgi:hypothetical protein